jgi:hypothetical protein
MHSQMLYRTRGSIDVGVNAPSVFLPGVAVIIILLTEVLTTPLWVVCHSLFGGFRPSRRAALFTAVRCLPSFQMYSHQSATLFMTPLQKTAAHQCWA